MPTSIYSDYVKDAADRKIKTAPNFIELARNFKWRYDIESESEYLDICAWAEGLWSGSSNPKPLTDVERIMAHVHYGYRPHGAEFRSSCAIWIREGAFDMFEDDHFAFFEVRFGDFVDIDERLKQQWKERADQEAEWERQAQEREDRKKRPLFDVHPDVKYFEHGIGDQTISPSRPVMVLTKMSLLPARLKAAGAKSVKTWRQSQQRVAHFSDERTALAAIASFAAHVNTVCRYTAYGNSVDYVFDLGGLDYVDKETMIDSYELERATAENDQIYITDSTSAVLMAIAHPELSVKLTRGDAE